MAKRPHLETTILVKWRVEIGVWWQVRLKKYIGIKLWTFCHLQGQDADVGEKLLTVPIPKGSPTCSSAHSQGSQEHAPEYPQIMVHLSNILFCTPGTTHYLFCSRQKFLFVVTQVSMAGDEAVLVFYQEKWKTAA